MSTEERLQRIVIAWCFLMLFIMGLGVGCYSADMDHLLERDASLREVASQ